jgi:hypothetical protein
MDHAGAGLLDLGEVKVDEPSLEAAAEQVVGAELQRRAAEDEKGGMVVGGDEAGEGPGVDRVEMPWAPVARVGGLGAIGAPRERDQTTGEGRVHAGACIACWR